MVWYPPKYYNQPYLYIGIVNYDKEKIRKYQILSIGYNYSKRFNLKISNSRDKI